MSIRGTTRAVVENVFRTVASSAISMPNGARQFHAPHGVFSTIRCRMPDISEAMIRRHVKTLCAAGYFQEVHEGRMIVALDLLNDVWAGLPETKQPRVKTPRRTAKRIVAKSESEPPTAAIITQEEPAAPNAQKAAPPPPAEPLRPWHYGGKPRILLVVDWSNIEEKTKSIPAAIRAVREIEEKLFFIGDIEAKFVFVPDHRVTHVESLARTYRYITVACPATFVNQNGRRHIKEKDGVDVRMTHLIGLISLFNANITHIVIVSGDGDFTHAVSYAKDHGRKVIVAAFSGHLSSELQSAADRIMLMRN